MSRLFPTAHGPFTADQIRPGDPYELSDGHAIRCLPTGGRGSGANATGATVLRSDPDVESVGVDAGFTPESGKLRAPDVAVGVSNEPGWTQGVPPLAVEYADRGQDEDDLQDKIKDLLSAGTQWIWVVRLDGPRRVEVHHQNEPMRLVNPGELLEAPGILRNSVPVEALYDWQAAEGITLRNLLQKQGYEDIEAVQAEGRREERRALLLELCESKGLELSADQLENIDSCNDGETLKRWFRRALKAATTEDIFKKP